MAPLDALEAECLSLVIACASDAPVEHLLSQLLRTVNKVERLRQAVKAALREVRS